MAKREMPTKKEAAFEKNIPMKLPQVIDSDPVDAVKPIVLMVDHCSDLNVRSGPNRKAAVVAIIHQGTTVIVKNMVDDWLAVNVPSLKINGYILAQYTSEVD
jgi:Bacterial SH3 domain